MKLNRPNDNNNHNAYRPNNIKTTINKFCCA